jgi:L-ribulose-5-phosphate 4-epimerase
MCEDDIVEIALDGTVLKGTKKPSVDWPHHAFIYKNFPGITGVVHTHSPYATAFAAAGLPIPCLTTGQADIFGGDIPVTDYADNTADNIGRTIVKCYRKGCPAILIGKHGVFTLAETPEKAVFAAQMTEFFAQINYSAIMLGRVHRKKLNPLPDAEIEKWYKRYHGGGYGQ